MKKLVAKKQHILALDLIDQLSPVSVSSIGLILNLPYSSTRRILTFLSKLKVISSMGHIGVPPNHIYKGKYYRAVRCERAEKMLGRLPKLPYGKRERRAIKYGESFGYRIGSDIYVSHHRIAIQYYLSVISNKIHDNLSLPSLSIRCFSEQYLKKILGWWGGNGEEPERDNVIITAIPDAVVRFADKEFFFEIEMNVRSITYYKAKYKFLNPITRPVLFAVRTDDELRKLAFNLPKEMNFFIFSMESLFSESKFMKWISSI